MQRKSKQKIIDLGALNNCILISGSGRSGTTWLQEIINYKNQYRILFEPFNKDKVDILSAWYYRQYLQPGIRDTQYLNPAKQILSGKIRNAWIDDKNQRPIAFSRLIKDIRTQFLLKWIKSNFHKIPIIMIIRHPCAVANSKLVLGWNAQLDQHLQELFTQTSLVQDHLHPFAAKVHELKDDFEKHIFLWCLEYYVPLRQFQENECLIIFYEALCQNYQIEIERIFTFISKPFTSEVLKLQKTPSALSRKDSPIITGSSLVSTWRKHITSEQIKTSTKILSWFGLDSIYSDGDMPIMDAEQVLSAFADSNIK